MDDSLNNPKSDLEENSPNINEAAKLYQLQSQLIANRQLKDENLQLKNRIERLMLQLSQIDLYKNQSLNLKKQLRVYEEKSKRHNTENKQKEVIVKNKLIIEPNIHEENKKLIAQLKEIEERYKNEHESLTNDVNYNNT